MKAIIELDVPEWQIGQPVTVYFKDTMIKQGICKENETWSTKRKITSDGVRCGNCNRLLRYDSKFCDGCGTAIKQ